ncbi:GLPGLI family protein [Flexibacter flexilis DSM 6793]|uniref:GLPGLI family protein n=1 Tax=Flexibacter flexilis DSM 6793 TaxID=927664 RepID=A0A1I1IN22_9BACT|nr:GLPGLI family protein [Flexibacter flexilis]SFC37634.1 GLPGLI family protein [Flexibacter flexilis DSM 6793]
MKKILLLLAVSFMAATAYAQQEGVVHFTRTTYWTKLNSQLTFLSKQEKERQAYMWGNRDDWKEYTVLYFNDHASKYTHSDEKSAEDMGYDWRKEQFVVTRDFEKNTLTDLVEIASKKYVVQDTLSPQKWKVLNDLKEVAGHICMKAFKEDTVKKQKIVAWFAQDIPVSVGPERSYGLPGMILELDLNDGTVVITASRIETKKLTNELDLPKKRKGTVLTEAGYQQTLSKFIKEKIKEERNPYWMVRY